MILPIKFVLLIKEKKEKYASRLDHQTLSNIKRYNIDTVKIYLGLKNFLKKKGE